MDRLLDLFHLYGQRLARFFIIVLILAMSWSLASSLLFFLQHSGEGKLVVGPGAGAGAAASAQNNVNPGQVELSLLNLFGSLGASDSDRQTVLAPTTRLNLVLQGIFMSDNKEESAAIIAEKNKEGTLYYLGDTLPGNAELYDVLDDYVLIKRSGNIEKLVFDDNSYRSVSAIGNNPAIDTLPSPSSASRRNSRGQPSGIIAPGDDHNQINNRAEEKESQLAEYRKRYESDPASVMNEFGVGLVEEGSAKGYKIESDAAGSMLKRSGLKEGDIILSVNGKPLGVHSSDLALLDQAQKARRLRIEVQRGSRKFFITVPINP